MYYNPLECDTLFALIRKVYPGRYGTWLIDSLFKNNIASLEKLEATPLETLKELPRIGPAGYERLVHLKHLLETQLVPGIDNEYLIGLLGERRAKELAKAVKEGKAIIVDGAQGPTGKTTEGKKLMEAGYPVVEEFNTYRVLLLDPVPGYENHPAFDEEWKNERIAMAIMLGE